MAAGVALSTAGIKVYYAVETTAGTKPASFTNEIDGFTEIGDLDAAPNMLDYTPLSETTAHRFIKGLKSVDTVEFTANLNDTFKTAWAGAVTAYAALTGGKDMWWKISIPGLSEAFYFTGEPASLGYSGGGVDAVQQVTAYVALHEMKGYDA